MQILSPSQRQTIAGGTSACRCIERAASTTDMPLPSFNPNDGARVFADTVTIRELWPI